MTDQPPNSNSTPGTEADNESWQEIGRQFQMMGTGLAAAFRTLWDKEENQQRLQEMRQGLNDMATQVNQAIKDTAHSPEGQKFKEEVSSAAGTLKQTARQAAEEARPHLISALEEVNKELQKLNDRLGSEAKPRSEGPGPDPS